MDTQTAAASTLLAQDVVEGSASAAALGSTRLDTIVVGISQDAYKGNAQFTISVDGRQVGGVRTATVRRGQGSEAISLQGQFSDGNSHKISVRFLNDVWDGGKLDRNLYVDYVKKNGQDLGQSRALKSAGSVDVAIGGSGASTPSSLPDTEFDLFAFAGQSNANGHFKVRSGDTSGGPLGKDVFQSELSNALGGPVRAIDVSRPGSGSNEVADWTNYWWNLASDKPSQTLLDAVSKIIQAESGGKSLDGLIWAQGEDDARRAFGSQEGPTLSRLTEATESIFAYIRQRLGDPTLPIFLQELGSLRDIPSSQYDAARATQARIVASDPHTYLGAKTSDLTQISSDRVHFNNAGYRIIADRLADSVSKVLNTNAGRPAVAEPADGTLVLSLSEHMYLGSAQFIASVDGQQLGAAQSVTARHDLGQTQDFSFTGAFGPGAHTLAVTFLNDVYNGTAATDRNLFVDAVQVNGIAYAGAAASLYSAGTSSFEFVVP